MIAYLDSNVFDFIAKVGDANSAKAIFDRRRLVILTSELHLLETTTIPNPSVRQNQLRTIVVLASQYTTAPIAWQHSQELRFEIGRLRPSWINSRPKVSSAKRYLQEHKNEWRSAQKGELKQQGQFQYRTDLESGIKTGRNFQKIVRTDQVTAKEPKSLTTRWNENGRTVDFALDDPESYWRAECSMSWYQAIVRRDPSSRNYSDYLGPFIKQDVFCDGTYASFWRNDVDPQRVPLNQITGLASFFQLEATIGHGNSYDALHANFGSKCEIFLTCDKNFFKVLSRLHAYLGGKFAIPVFIDKSVSDVNAELELKLDSAIGSG